jgi:FkbM family methyltransferase
MYILIQYLSCRKFLPNYQPYDLYKTKQGLWIALIDNDLISEYIKRHNIWEQNVTNYLIKNVKPNQTVIEIGANIGYYTILLAQLVSPGGHVYAYEANDEVYDFTKFSLRMNGLSDIVKIKNIGILDKAGEFNMRYTKLHNNSLSETNIGGANITFAEKVPGNDCVKKVQVVSLDENLPNLKNVDWLRMDIEGSELPAILGAKRIIESSPNLKIVMEWAPNMLKNFGNVSDFINLLYSYGFRFYKIEENGDLGKEKTKAELLGEELTNFVLIRDKNSSKPN